MHTFIELFYVRKYNCCTKKCSSIYTIKYGMFFVYMIANIMIKKIANVKFIGYVCGYVCVCERERETETETEREK